MLRFTHTVGITLTEAKKSFYLTEYSLFQRMFQIKTLGFYEQSAVRLRHKIA